MKIRKNRRHGTIPRRPEYCHKGRHPYVPGGCRECRLGTEHDWRARQPKRLRSAQPRTFPDKAMTSASVSWSQSDTVAGHDSPWTFSFSGPGTGSQTPGS